MKDPQLVRLILNGVGGSLPQSSLKTEAFGAGYAQRIPSLDLGVMVPSGALQVSPDGFNIFAGDVWTSVQYLSYWYITKF